MEFLDFYAQPEEDRLKDITNLYRPNSYPSSLSLSDSSQRQEKSDKQDDRIYLRSIVKRSKREPTESRESKASAAAASSRDCCEGASNLTSINISYECRLL